MKKTTLLILLFTAYSLSYSQGSFEVDGTIVIGDLNGNPPVLGMIQYNPLTKDFEGWNGKWMSLTQSSSPNGSGMVTDIDGNKYLTIRVGNQTWMRENLRVTRYRNGDPINEFLLKNDWQSASSGGWCWYDNDPEKDQPYGKLYNWYAVDDPRGLCPSGWHVPTDAEWFTLTTLLDENSGSKMKTVGTLSIGGHWSPPNLLASNESGFTGLPGGYRRSEGTFYTFRWQGYWWNRILSVNGEPWYRSLNTSEQEAYRGESDKRSGFSVRCVKN